MRNEKFIANPPGVTIREQLEANGISVDEFAHSMKLTVHEAVSLLTGRTQITPSIAERLAKVVGVSASYWKNLEALYRDKLQSIEESEAT